MPVLLEKRGSHLRRLRDLVENAPEIRPASLQDFSDLLRSGEVFLLEERQGAQGGTVDLVGRLGAGPIEERPALFLVLQEHVAQAGRALFVRRGIEPLDGPREQGVTDFSFGDREIAR